MPFGMEVKVGNDCLKTDPSFGLIDPSGAAEVECTMPDFESGQLYELRSGDILQSLHDGCIGGIINRALSYSRFDDDS